MMEQREFEENERDPTFKELSANIFPDRKKKVMVIDDDVDFRLLICELLVDEGFIVSTAKDGEIGLNQLVHQKDLPDLIIVDVLMPVKSGMEFRREQLQLDEINEIPVVFITGQGYVEGESCLLKPIDEREFIQTIKDKLGMYS